MNLFKAEKERIKRAEAAHSYFENQQDCTKLIHTIAVEMDTKGTTLHNYLRNNIRDRKITINPETVPEYTYILNDLRECYEQFPSVLIKLNQQLGTDRIISELGCYNEPRAGFSIYIK